MARGRMISDTLGRSKKFNRLPDHFTKLVYTLVLTTADAEGRIEADSVDIYGDHFVRDPDPTVDAERVEAALQACHDVGLVQLYEIGEKRYGQFVGFHEHNKIRRKEDGTPLREAPSRIPPPPDSAEVRSDRAGGAQEVRSYCAVPQHKGLRVKSEEQSVKGEGDSSEDRFERLMTTGFNQQAETARVRGALRRTAGTAFARKHEDSLVSWARWTNDDITRLWDAAGSDEWTGNAASKPRAYLFEDLLNETRTPPGSSTPKPTALLNKYRGAKGVIDGTHFEVIGASINGDMLMTDAAGYLTPQQVEEAVACLN